MQKEINLIQNEVEKVISGKTEVIRKILMAILAEGHILLDDVPGVGKTTMAVALGKTMNLVYNRVQFTPDVLPSDIVGFSMYNKETGAFEYKPGIVTETNLLLGDEINRTSSKTQSALLEAMEENQVTVDGHTYPLKGRTMRLALVAMRLWWLMVSRVKVSISCASMAGARTTTRGSLGNTGVPSGTA